MRVGDAVRNEKMWIILWRICKVIWTSNVIELYCIIIVWHLYVNNIVYSELCVDVYNYLLYFRKIWMGNKKMFGKCIHYVKTAYE